MKSFTYPMLIVLVMLLGARVALATPSEDASTRVEAGMSIEAVEKAIGFRPNVVEQKTCGGTDSVPAWYCRVQIYADGKRTLLIYFIKADSRLGWAVHSWYLQ